MSLLNHSFNLLTPEVQVTRFKWYTYMYDFLNKCTYCTTVKHHRTAVCSHHHTVISLGFENMALLWYGQHLYSTVFCTAITVYSMVESHTKTACPLYPNVRNHLDMCPLCFEATLGPPMGLNNPTPTPELGETCHHIGTHLNAQQQAQYFFNSLFDSVSSVDLFTCILDPTLS
jgi:hypothetical protein